MKNACDVLFETLKSQDETLGDLRLKGAVYYQDQNSLHVDAISDIAVSIEGKNYILKALKDRLNGVKEITLTVAKSVVDKDLAKKVIIEKIKTRSFHISHMITDDTVNVISVNKRVVFELNLTENINDYFERTSEMNKLIEELSRSYAHEFVGSIKIVQEKTEAPTYEEESLNYLELEDSTLRYVKMQSVYKLIDDTVYDTAMYIQDGLEKLGTVFFAGVVVEKTEKATKNGKPYFVITVDDQTAKVTGRFFTADKNKLKKLEKIDVGSVIIMRGENESFNGAISYNIKGLHLCEYPANFKPKEKPSLKAPDNYSLIFPKKIESARQSDFFTIDKGLPIEVQEGVFTVVDIETTGTETAYDKITEIAGVKIENGVITEYYHTLVNPEVHISDRIVELTGIDDELVKDSPKISEVYPDFFKFVENTVFVAHNAEFDFRFLYNAGKELGYIMKNKTLDTLYLSRKILPGLKNHKLNTVCEHFNITFNHHRALSDAMATAEMFLELLKGKKSLKDI